MGQCFKDIELVFSTYPRLLLNIYLVEQPIGNWEICRGLLIGQNAKGKLAEITPVKNVNRRVFAFTASNLFFGIKLDESLKKKTTNTFSLGLELSNNT